MPIIESVLDRKTNDGKTFWIAVFDDGKEAMAWDIKVKDFKNKECPYPIIKTKSGKDMIAFPKEGGFQGKSGGGWKGKSDREITLGALTMAMSYAKDLTVMSMPLFFEKGKTYDIVAMTIDAYKAISKNLLADLKAIEGEAPKQEAVKEAVKPTVATPQPTSPPKAPATPKDTENMTVKEKLAKEMWQYLQNTHSDTDENFKTLLMEVSGFPGKDKATGELTGKMVVCDDWDRLTDGWAKSSLRKLRELVEEDERKDVANADLGDIAF